MKCVLPLILLLIATEDVFLKTQVLLSVVVGMGPRAGNVRVADNTTANPR